MSMIRCEETTFCVLAEVAAERVRQDAKWGQQDHPCVTELSQSWEPDVRASFYGVMSEAAAKRQCERRFAEGVGTYADIAIEEVAEAVCAEDDAKRRAELVQCAAVFVAWIEAIDRRNARALDSVSMDPPPASPASAFTDSGLDRLEGGLYRMGWPNRSVLVYGPPGCGKTRHAKAIAAHFDLPHIVDDWNSRADPLPREGTLILTNDPAALGRYGREVHRYDFDAVADLVGLKVSA